MINLNPRSPELAEFLGAMIGDGFIGAYGRTTKTIQITGNKVNEKAYYQDYLIPLINRVIGTKVNLYELKNCLRLTIYSKDLFEALKNQFSFPTGKKGEIKIPLNIIQTDACKLSIVRGLFDTDGSIHLQRKKYPVLAITTTSQTLALQVQKIINEFGLGSYICKSNWKEYKKAYRVTIFGKQKVLKWREIIGSSNPYHRDRINALVA